MLSLAFPETCPPAPCWLSGVAAPTHSIQELLPRDTSAAGIPAKYGACVTARPQPLHGHPALSKKAFMAFMAFVAPSGRRFYGPHSLVKWAATSPRVSAFSCPLSDPFSCLGPPRVLGPPGGVVTSSPRHCQLSSVAPQPQLPAATSGHPFLSYGP